MPTKSQSQPSVLDALTVLDNTSASKLDGQGARKRVTEADYMAQRDDVLAQLDAIRSTNSGREVLVPEFTDKPTGSFGKLDPITAPARALTPATSTQAIPAISAPIRLTGTGDPVQRVRDPEARAGAEKAVAGLSPTGDVARDTLRSATAIHADLLARKQAAIDGATKAPLAALNRAQQELAAASLAGDKKRIAAAEVKVKSAALRYEAAAQSAPNSSYVLQLDKELASAALEVDLAKGGVTNQELNEREKARLALQDENLPNEAERVKQLALARAEAKQDFVRTSRGSGGGGAKDTFEEFQRKVDYREQVRRAGRKEAAEARTEEQRAMAVQREELALKKHDRDIADFIAKKIISQPFKDADALRNHFFSVQRALAVEDIQLDGDAEKLVMRSVLQKERDLALAQAKKDNPFGADAMQHLEAYSNMLGYFTPEAPLAQDALEKDLRTRAADMKPAQATTFLRMIDSLKATNGEAYTARYTEQADRARQSASTLSASARVRAKHEADVSTVDAVLTSNVIDMFKDAYGGATPGVASISAKVAGDRDALAQASADKATAIEFANAGTQPTIAGTAALPSAQADFASRVAAGRLSPTAPESTRSALAQYAKAVQTVRSTYATVVGMDNNQLEGGGVTTELRAQAKAIQMANQATIARVRELDMLAANARAGAQDGLREQRDRLLSEVLANTAVSSNAQVRDAFKDAVDKEGFKALSTAVLASPVAGATNAYEASVIAKLPEGMAADAKSNVAVAIVSAARQAHSTGNPAVVANAIAQTLDNAAGLDYGASTELAEKLVEELYQLGVTTTQGAITDPRIGGFARTPAQAVSMRSFKAQRAQSRMYSDLFGIVRDMFTGGSTTQTTPEAQ